MRYDFSEAELPCSASDRQTSTAPTRNRWIRSLFKRYPAFAFAQFRLFWLASFASVGATQLVFLAQTWLAFELTGSALDLGLLGAAIAVPNMVMLLLGGAVADRFDKRLILIACTAITAFLLLFLAVLDATGSVQIWHVWAIAALNSLIAGIDWPSRQAIFTQLVDRPALPSAVALNAILWQSSRMIMPAIGGIIIAASDTWVAFVVAALGHLTLSVVLTRMPAEQNSKQTGSALSHIAEGLIYIRSQPLFLWLIVLTFCGTFFATAYFQLMPLFADKLALDERGFGLLLSTTGLGSVSGTLIVGTFRLPRRLGVYLIIAAASAIVSLFGFAWAVSVACTWFAFFSVYLTSGFTSIFLINVMTILQIRVPEKLRGRVMSVHTMSFSMMSLGALAMGAIANKFGAGLSLVYGASGFAIGLLLIGITQSVIRNYKHGIDG